MAANLHFQALMSLFLDESFANEPVSEEFLQFKKRLIQLFAAALFV
jgi:hypothetical protein